MSIRPSDGSNPGVTHRPYAREHLANIVSAVRDHSNPTQIGPYFIEQLIGEGGMGSVYKAEQREPIRRTVAIKVIKLGMDTREVIARFESERQALALMNHPNVARVIDAGATHTGRPYFVMEFVDGEPITTFADKHKLTVQQRLELFTQACDAVQHAHQKAIIHRDLKPSNILVTTVDGKPIVKVIDFGVAKAISQRLTERTMFTETGQLMGTPEYMSPEQAESVAVMEVDTRSDVYSLGVVLYELLTGALPFDPGTLRSAGYAEIQRIIRDVDPPRPSTRLSGLGNEAQEIARRRQAPLDSLERQLKSELEWIPLKAMRKDRAQRYATTAELSEDIANYLSNRPLRAGPESRVYRARKFLRRNKTGVAVSAAMILLLISGVVATSWQAVRAKRAEARALEERDNAQATLEFLTNDVLDGATPERIPDTKIRDEIVKAMITPAAERFATKFRDRPLIEASIRDIIRDVLAKIGRRDLALQQSEAAVQIYRRELGDDHLDTLEALNNYGSLLDGMGRAADAEPVLRQVLERRRQALGADDPHSLVTLNNYAHVLYALGRSAQAEPLYKEALERRRRVSGNDDPDTITVMTNYAAALRALDRVTEAEPLFREALERCRRVLGDDHPQTISAINNYGYVLKSLNRREEAAGLFRETLERRRRVLGEDHPDAIWSLCEYALVLQSEKRNDEAEPLLKQALERSRRVQGPDHAISITILNNYAGFLMTTGRPVVAEPLVKEGRERRRRVVGEDHRETLISLNNYAMVLRALGRTADAEPLVRRAVKAATTNPSLGPKHRDTRQFATSHAKILDELGRHAEAATVRTEFGLPEPTTRGKSS
jgi:serine/threonine protein kinase